MARKNYRSVIPRKGLSKVESGPRIDHFVTEKFVVTVEKMRLSGWYVNVHRQM
jgi:hypothetical protein